MNWLGTMEAALASKLAPLICTAVVHWLALLLLCSAYLQGGFTKALAFDLATAEMKQFGFKPAVPLAVLVIVLEIGASMLILTGFFRWAGALALGVFTAFATYLANRFWKTPLPARYATENSFFEHLGLVGGFLLVAWYDLQQVASLRLH
jgi:uncharacterized membrane protein YphA (DoxX/SURF4 family)